MNIALWCGALGTHFVFYMQALEAYNTIPLSANLTCNVHGVKSTITRSLETFVDRRVIIFIEVGQLTYNGMSEIK